MNKTEDLLLKYLDQDKLTSFPPVSIKVANDRRLANPSFSVLLTSWGQCFFHLYP